MTTTADKAKKRVSETDAIKKINLANWIEKVKETVSAGMPKTDDPPPDRTDEALASLSSAEPADIQTIAASQINLLTGHYEMILRQAEKTFKAAKFALIAGALLFTLAVVFMMTGKNQAIIILGFVGAALVELISGVNFYFYWKTVSQLKGFHFRCDRIQSYLLANSVCERLDGEAQTASRQELIRKIAAIDGQRANGQTGPGEEKSAAGDAQAQDWKY